MSRESVRRHVSVIVPTRDRPELLGEALSSIRALEGPDLTFEILVGDNGLSLATRAVVERFGGRYLPVEQEGAASARNAGLRAATGEYIAHLDDDDLWTPEHIRPHLALLETRPDLMTVVGQILSTDTARKPIGVPWPAALPDHNQYFMTFMRYFPQIGGTVSRISVRDTVGEFDEALLGDADWDWQLRIAKAHPVGFVPVPSVLFRQRPEGEADAIHLRRVPHTRRIFFRHALPEWRRWESPQAFLRSYNRAMEPYYNYFVATAVARAQRGDRVGSRSAIGHAFKLIPLRVIRDVVVKSEIRNSLLSAFKH